MSTALTETAGLEALKASVTSELKSQAPSGREITGQAVASSIKTVAALEFQTAVAALPDGVLNIFAEAKMEPGRTYQLNDILRRVAAA